MIIAQHLKDDPLPEGLLIELNRIFINEDSNILENYTIKDITKFKSSLKEIKKIVLEDFEEKIGNQEIISFSSLIKQMERITYYYRISDYKSNEVLWNEAKMVKDEYIVELVEGKIFQFRDVLNNPLSPHYKINIDFFDYPPKPLINIREDLNRELGKILDKLSYFYKNWKPKKSPHLIKIIRELEAFITKFKEQEKLSDIGESPNSYLPELKSLSNVIQLEKEKKINSRTEITTHFCL